MSQNVPDPYPDLCETCVTFVTNLDIPEILACLNKDLVDKQVCLKGGKICIEVDAAVEETINLIISFLSASTDPREICTLAGYCENS